MSHDPPQLWGVAAYLSRWLADGPLAVSIFIVLSAYCLMLPPAHDASRPHSDRGSQYDAGHAGHSQLAAHKMVCSMSRKGYCFDNAGGGIVLRRVESRAGRERGLANA